MLRDLFGRTIPQSYRLLSRSGPGCLRLDSEQARNGLMVGFIEAFWAGSEKHETNLFRMGRIALIFWILRRGMEFKKISFLRRHVHRTYILVHI